MPSFSIHRRLVLAGHIATFVILATVALSCCHVLAQAPAAKSDPTSSPPMKWMLEPTPVPNSVAQKADEMKGYTEQIAGTEAEFEMVPIAGGTFTMGSPEDEEDRLDDEGPQFEVSIEPFWMAKCEVTWDDYELWAMGLSKQRRKVLGLETTKYDELADVISMPTKPYTDMTFGMGKEDYPAICMTQLAAKMYCKWLSAKTGRYYRLPTEAEWEYACRAGTTTAYSFGDDPDELEDYAWFFDNSEDKYQTVGQKKANPWGLHDMHGNVAEWVLDQYSEEGYAQLAKNPKNPVALPTTIFPRTIRGGSWVDDPDALRSAARRFSAEEWKTQDPQLPQSVWYHTDADFVGFRVVRPLRTPDAEEAVRFDVDDVQRQDMEDYNATKGIE